MVQLVYYANFLYRDIFPMRETLFKLLYPGESGYHSPGNLRHMRNSQTIQNIRGYQKKFYREENLNLIISGKIDQHQIFKGLASIEKIFLEK